MQGLAIIIPVLNEAQNIKDQLELLQPLRKQGVLVVVVDGGSDDGTLQIAKFGCDLAIEAEKGRARQMNAGAQAALTYCQQQQWPSPCLAFLHSDTCLPQDFMRQYQDFNRGANQWGFFPLALDAQAAIYRLIAFMISLRSRFSGIATGDQVLLLKPELWQDFSGFEELALMEDLAFSYRCKKLKLKPWCASSKVVTSARRWQQFGVLKTVSLMWLLRAAFYCGVDAKHLAKLYR